MIRYACIYEYISYYTCVYDNYIVVSKWAVVYITFENCLLYLYDKVCVLMDNYVAMLTECVVGGLMIEWIHDKFVFFCFVLMVNRFS